MNLGNIGLWLAVAVFGWAGWIFMDMSGPAASVSGSSSLSAVHTSKVPVLVEFYADWCGPCKEVGPVVDKLAVELSGKARVIRINVDDQPELAAQNGIQGIPTFIAYKGGREVARQSGGIPRSMMLQMLGL
jgi:thioredoxin 1